MSANNTSLWDDYENKRPDMPLWQSAVIGTILVAIILATIVGNLLVIISFLTVKSLRHTVSNYYLFNLAIADFIVGIISMPADTSKILLGRWPYGEVACKIWTILDYSATIESTFVICFITVDRYWLVTNVMRYRLQSKKRPIIGCCISWIVALVFYSVMFTSFDKFTHYNSTIDYSQTCETVVINNLIYNAIMIFFEFLIPFAIVVGLNSLIYIKIKRRNQIIKKELLFAKSTKSPGMGRGKNNESIKMNLAVRKETIPASSSAVALQQPYCYPTDVKNPENDMGTNCMATTKRKISPAMAKDTHSKTARTLAVLCIVYFLCWGPYQFVLLLNLLCESCYNSTLWTILTYALWSNSLINPVLYALCSTRFRAALLHTLCCILNCRRLSTRSLGENYNSVYTTADPGNIPRKDIQVQGNDHYKEEKKGKTKTSIKAPRTKENHYKNNICNQHPEKQSLAHLLSASKETVV